MTRAMLFLALLALPACVHFQDRKLDTNKSLAAFEQRSLADSNLVRFLASNRVSATEKWNLDSLTFVAFYYHPSLDLARAQWSSARASIRRAGGRPNPTIGLLPGYNFNAASGVSPWKPTITYDLPIETAGKRARRMDRAKHLSQAARFNIVTSAWQVRSALRTALLDLFATTQRELALQAQLQSSQTILQLMEQRLLAGAVSATELFPARVAAMKSRSDLIDLKRQLVDARSRIADSLGMPLKALDSAEFDFPQAAETNEIGFSAVRRTALQGRADLLSALAEYDASQSALQLEIARQYPDIHLGSNYQWDQGENKWSLGVTFELPVLNRNQGPIAEAEAKRSEAAARFTALQAKAISEVDRAMATRKAVADQLKEAESLVKAHRDQLSNLQAALQQGAADRVEVETANFELRTSELSLLDLKIKARQAVGQLEDALQRPFDSLRLIEQDPKRTAAKQ